MPYGFANFDLDDADGAWVGSVIDLAKFAAMLDGTRPRAPISPDSFAAMIAQTPRNTWVDSVGWYGFGLFAMPQLGGITWSHGGSLPGTRSYFFRFANGICYAFLFNGDSKDQTSLTSLRRAVGMGHARRCDRLAGPRPLPAILPSTRRALWSGQRRIFPAGPACSGIVDHRDRRGSGGKDPTSRLPPRSGGAERPVHLLYSGPGQLNGVLPGEALPGDATLIVRREGWPDRRSGADRPGVAGPVHPQSGRLGRRVPGPHPARPASVLGTGLPGRRSGNVIAKPIVFGGEDEDLSLVLYCTGVRGRRGAEVTVQLGDLALVAGYAGPQRSSRDWTRSMLGSQGASGKGEVSVRAEVDGLWSNGGSLTFR